jgi:hypothetical protein
MLWSTTKSGSTLSIPHVSLKLMYKSSLDSLNVRGLRNKYGDIRFLAKSYCKHGFFQAMGGKADGRLLA